MCLAASRLHPQVRCSNSEERPIFKVCQMGLPDRSLGVSKPSSLIHQPDKQQPVLFLLEELQLHPPRADLQFLLDFLCRQQRSSCEVPDTFPCCHLLGSPPLATSSPVRGSHLPPPISSDFRRVCVYASISTRVYHVRLSGAGPGQSSQSSPRSLF